MASEIIPSVRLQAFRPGNDHGGGHAAIVLILEALAEPLGALLPPKKETTDRTDFTGILFPSPSRQERREFSGKPGWVDFN